MNKNENMFNYSLSHLLLCLYHCTVKVWWTFNFSKGNIFLSALDKCGNMVYGCNMIDVLFVMLSMNATWLMFSVCNVIYECNMVDILCVMWSKDATWLMFCL